MANVGQTISCVRLLESMLSRDEIVKANDLPDGPELSQLVERADREYQRVKDCGEDYYLAVFNPSFMVLSSDLVATIMTRLGSTKSITGEWAPVVIKHLSSFYKIWAKSSLCG